MDTIQKKKPAGQTKGAGWQFGLRKTFHLASNHVWDFLFSEQGLSTWLGKLDQDLSLHESYRTSEGVEGRVNLLAPYSHIRLTWKSKSRRHFTHLQLRVMGDSHKTTVSFHHDHLENEKERESVKAYWNEKMREIGEKLLASAVSQ